MALSMGKKIVAAVVVVLAFILVQIIVVKKCSFQTRAIVLRAEFILVLQTIMFMFSLGIWKTFAPMFSSMPASPHESAEGSVSNGGSTMSRRSLRKSKNSEVDLSSFNPGENHSVLGGSSLPFWKTILLGYLGMCHVSYLTNLFIISTDPHWFSMLTYTCLGSFIQLNTGLYAFKLLSFLIHQFRRITSSSLQPKGLSRRTIAVLSFVYMMCASSLGLYTASQPPSVRHVDIPVRDLPQNLEGLRIIQLSDIHLGPTVGISRLQKIVEIVQKQNPGINYSIHPTDMVVLTGDLVDGSVERLKKAAQPLGTLHTKYGNFFVSGNHEYYTGDVDNWFVFLQSLGFTVLHNSNVRVPSKVNEGQGQICIAGTDDVQADKIGYDGHKFDLDKAVSSCSPTEPVILLAHQPAAAKIALDSQYRIDLVLSGHTHGGQVFPMVIGAYLMNPFYAGLYKYGDKGSHVYVSQGTQYWGVPMRLATSMEITRITLRRTP